MSNVAVSAHFRYGNQTFNTGLELGEGTKIVQAKDAAIYHITLFDLAHSLGKGILLQGFHRKTDLIALDIEDLYFHFLIDLEVVLRLDHVEPGNLGDVHQAFDSTQIDECAKGSHTDDLTGHNFAYCELGEGSFTLLGILLFCQLTVGNHNAAAVF